MPRLTMADVEAARRQSYRAVLLQLTDRCPVGCAHCSVSALPGGPAEDLDLLAELVAAICTVPRFQVVGISGGEPFVARRSLQLATEQLAAAGRDIVLYTSGMWGNPAAGPGWIDRVLARCSCVVLGVDTFHLTGIPRPNLVAALRAVVARQVWLVVQVIDEPRQRALATGLLAEALGERWSDVAQVWPVPLLRRGRAAGAQHGPGHHPQHVPLATGRSFGPCSLLGTPVIRSDGTVLACCNESVVTGGGPATLRRRAGTGAELISALDELATDPHLVLTGRIGPGALTALPGLRDLADQEFPDVCALCWRVLARDVGPDAARRHTLLSALTGSAPTGSAPADVA